MTKTWSETLFEQFCERAQIGCTRIEEGADKTPDYELTVREQLVIAEVKEITRNREELESDRLLAERGFGSDPSYTPGERARKKIADASPQIKARCKGIYPGMLVLFDGGFSCRHLDPYNVRVGMYGLEQVHFAIPPIDSGRRPYSIGMSYGPHRKMTEDCNTSISALGVLVTPGPEEIVLQLYHNKFAAIPISPELFVGAGITQFELEPQEWGSTAKWTRVRYK